MSTLNDNRDQAGLVADFGRRIEELRRDGLPSYPPLGARSPWAGATEQDKLEEIVSESTRVWLVARSDTKDGSPQVISVPGGVTLDMIERHVDLAGLPAAQRDRLEEIRAKLDAGRLAGREPDQSDAIMNALGRIVAIGHLDEMVRRAKDRTDRPWAVLPESDKVRRLGDMAAEAGPPGGYALQVIEREVDYSLLPPWRRQGLEDVRARLDRGELEGEDPNPAHRRDRVLLALGLAELDGRIGDYRHGGGGTDVAGQPRWADLLEAARFDAILWDIRDLHLDSETAAYQVMAREVDLARLPEGQRLASFHGQPAQLREAMACDTKLPPELRGQSRENAGLAAEESARHVPTPAEIAGSGKPHGREDHAGKLRRLLPSEIATGRGTPGPLLEKTNDNDHGR